VPVCAKARPWACSAGERYLHPRAPRRAPAQLLLMVFAGLGSLRRAGRAGSPRALSWRGFRKELRRFILGNRGAGNSCPSWLTCANWSERIAAEREIGRPGPARGTATISSRPWCPFPGEKVMSWPTANPIFTTWQRRHGSDSPSGQWLVAPDRAGLRASARAWDRPWQWLRRSHGGGQSRTTCACRGNGPRVASGTAATDLVGQAVVVARLPARTATPTQFIRFLAGGTRTWSLLSTRAIAEPLPWASTRRAGAQHRLDRGDQATGGWRI